MTHHPKKHLGQHFLQDHTVIHDIVQAIYPKKGEHLVEIGPGLGALTQALLPIVHEVDVIEFDKDVIPTLTKICQPLGNLHIHLGDVLHFDFSTLYSKHIPLRIVGNLPYQISTPLLFHLIQYADFISDMHFMLQKEVVDRMSAHVGTKSYGRLSVMTQYHFEAESLFKVKPDAFYPKPEVTSAVVRLTPKKLSFTAHNYSSFSTIVREAFNHRRKTLHNALKNIVTLEQMMTVGVDPNCRPEEVSVEAFIKLANEITSERH